MGLLLESNGTTHAKCPELYLYSVHDYLLAPVEIYKGNN